MPSKIFNSQEDFQSRVTDTMVTFDGEVYFATPSSSQPFHLNLKDFPSPTIVHKEIHVDDDRLHLGALRLGLFNNAGEVYIVNRTPTRRYRYGTPPEFLTTTNVSNVTKKGGGGDLYTTGFRDMLRNRYPSVPEALSDIRLSGGKSSYAVSRSFFLKENALGLIQVQFRELGPVLWVSPDGSLNFVEKSPTSRYLTQCSRQLSRIIEELRANAL